MWIWIIGAAIVCCVVAAFAQAEEDEEKKKVAARRPDALIRLFSEEFPDFSGAVTFSKAEAAIKAWDTAIASYNYKKHLKIFDKKKFKNDNAAKQAMSHVTQSVAQEISPEFVSYLSNRPVDEAYASMRRAMDSSVTLAGQ